MKKYDSVLVGEINLDMILTGLKQMPVLGRELLCESLEMVLGGSTSICGCALAGLGLRCGFVSRIGDDYFGRSALKLVRDAGVDTALVQIDSDLKSGLTISFSLPQDRALITYPGSIAALSAEDVPEEVLDGTRHIHVGSYFLQSRLRPGLPALFKRAHKRQVLITLDAGWDETEAWNDGIWDTLSNVDVFFPNESEACAITGKENVEEAARELARCCRIVVVKCGSSGAYLQSGEISLWCAAYSEFKPVDPTGAGDSFNAGFIYGMLHSKPLEDCLRYGNACAAVSITHVGGASRCATAQEIENIVLGRGCTVYA